MLDIRNWKCWKRSFLINYYCWNATSFYNFRSSINNNCSDEQAKQHKTQLDDHDLKVLISDERFVLYKLNCFHFLCWSWENLMDEDHNVSNLFLKTLSLKKKIDRFQKQKCFNLYQRRKSTNLWIFRRECGMRCFFFNKLIGVFLVSCLFFFSIIRVCKCII